MDPGAHSNGFPRLPILSSSEIPPPRLSQREKYGGLFYVGIAGLVFLIGLVGVFTYGMWSLRGVATDIYVLHDAKRPDAERIVAAFRLSRDPNLEDLQRMTMSLERDLPELARYLLAESVSVAAVAHDPRGFALAVARSPDWPDWLRLLLTRRLAYGAGRGYAIPVEPLEELARHTNPMIRDWATYALAVRPGARPQDVAELEKLAEDPSDSGKLATFLLGALHVPQQRDERLDRQSEWMRRHHPEAARMWQGWGETEGRLVQLKAQ